MKATTNFFLSGQYSVVTGAHLPLSGFPSMILPNGQPRVKRMTYLSEVRNQLLRPLDDPHSSQEDFQGNYTDTKFDRILFLNDIYFKPVDAIQLLFSTNLNPSTGTANYDVACAADFVKSIMFYDTMVVRDYEGYGMGVMFFPWFTSKGNAISRNDVLAEKDAVRVRSCWGGMVSFAATHFQQQDAMEAAQNEKSVSALRFRHQHELYWEASECCLIHADLATRTESEAKIFLNPYIRVTYNAHSWSWMPFTQKIERVFKILQYVVSNIGYPEYNPRRLEVPGESSVQTRWIYKKESLNGEALRDLSADVPSQDLGGQWMDTRQTAHAGGFCGQRRLFVMKRDLRDANKQHSGRNWEKGVWPNRRR
jgi:hypothetical protein